MRAALIGVGTELVADGRPDTNGATLARILASRGIETVLRIQVPDEEVEIARVLAEAAARFPVVLVTGGLGPTRDDRTREGLARAFDIPLREDSGALEEIARRYTERGRTMSPAAARQALVPEGALLLSNPAGTAPGLLLARPDGALIALLPGVPHEMERMMRELVLPRLPSMEGGIVTRGLKTAGLTEIEIEEALSDLFTAPAPERARVDMSILASAGEISLILRSREPQAAGDALAEARRRLGEAVFAVDSDEGLESVVGRMLSGRGQTVAIAESCTGGLLSGLLTRVPGASGWFGHGWVVYADEAKSTQLGVDDALVRAHGAVSSEVASAMAEGARLRSGADWALGVTGIAGPDGGTPAKPVGLVYTAVARGAVNRAREHRFGGDRETIRLLAARTALERLRRAMQREG